MNRKLTLKHSRLALAAGLLVCGTVAASANTLVTFKVDMSWASAHGLFASGSQTMSVAGTFNNWGSPTFLALTNNPGGTNPDLWSGTADIPTNGVTIIYKYVIQPGSTYENSSHNRILLLPTTSGASATVPTAYFEDIPNDPFTNNVTFQVDMAQQINTGAFIPGTSSVYVRGGFNGWGQDVAMTNDPTILRTNQFGLVTSNVYVMTYEINGSPGQTIDFKYYFDTGTTWDSPTPYLGDFNDNGNRFVNLMLTNQALPIVYFSDAIYAPVASNAVTFQVDMTSQVLNGTFDPTVGTVEVRGNFNSWGNNAIYLTNNPAAPNTNLYKQTVVIQDGVGAIEQYKFASTAISINGGWEQLASTTPQVGGNRFFAMPDAKATTLPLVYFSDLNPSDLLPADMLVTFSVSMTNAVGTDTHAFDPAADQVFINGVPNGFATWGGGLPQLTNNPVGSEIYSVDILVPKGSPVGQIYKYSINGADNEGPTGANHARYIRNSASGRYVMPMDVFTASPPVEPSFGNLTVSPAAAGHAKVSFLGRPGVHLQSASSLNPPVNWTDLTQTDGGKWTGTTSASANGTVTVTNVPTLNTTGSFYRLIKQ